jgi:transposase
LLTEGQQSDHKGAAVLLANLPPAKTLIGDKGYDSDAFRDGLRERKIQPCIPPRRGRKSPASYCKNTYKRRHKVENMFAKIKDWRRIATRYDRCAHTFMAAIKIACILIF